MSMTREQAMVELARLCESLGRTLDRLTPRQKQVWTKALKEMRPEAARAAIDRVIDTWSWGGFPPVGALRRAAEEASGDGRANAEIYLQLEPREPTAEERRHAAAMLEQQDKWRDMDEDVYFDELIRLQDEGKVGI